jgi:Peptidase family S41/Tricorn protease C1 domain
MNRAQLILIIILLNFIAGCKQERLLKQKQSPVAVFNEVWEVLDKRYALFSLKNTDWNAVHAEFKTSIRDDMTERELFKKISQMLERLKDGHVALLSPSDTAVYDQFYTIYPKNFNWQNIVNNYLNNQYKTSGPLIYKISGQIGYIYYPSFAQAITDEQAASVFREMSSVKGIIIDVRNNTGGSVTNAEKLIRFFMPRQQIIKYELIKKGTGHNDFFEPQPFNLNPGAILINKPAVVLTNRACFSACNDFVLYSSTLPGIKIVGDQTGGGGGIPYNYILANGWKLQYTATMTLSPGKQPVENGIQPHINASISSLEEAAGRDPVLETAIRLLQ